MTSQSHSAPSRARLGWLGFDGRTFLTKEEHETYCRRLPVRYPRKNLRITGKCSICGGRATPENPLQVAHRIPFGRGITQFWLTPDWLDGPHNLVWAHKRGCNKKAEISIREITKHVQKECNVKVPKNVPTQRYHGMALMSKAHQGS